MFKDDFNIYESCSTRVQAGIWIQMSVATELLIFSARAPKYIFNSIAPSPALLVSVIVGSFILSVLACAVPFFGDLYVSDVAIIWTYDIICLFVVDVIKVAYLKFNDEFIDVLPDGVEVESHDEDNQLVGVEGGGREASDKAVAAPSVPLIIKALKDDDSASDVSRSTAAQLRMSQWQTSRNAQSFGVSLESGKTQFVTADRSVSTSDIFIKRSPSNTSIIARRNLSGTGIATSGYTPVGLSEPTPASIISSSGGVVSHSQKTFGTSRSLTGSSGVNLRPHTPSNIRR